MLFKREAAPLWAAAALCLAVASYGFWGERFTAVPVSLLEEIAADASMQDPVPSFSPAAEGGEMGAPTLAGRPWGNTPFLTAPEEARYGPEHRSIGARATASSAPGGAEHSPPDVRALINAGGKPVILLGGGAARIGQEAGGVRVIGVDGRRVLVEGENGREWIEIVPLNRGVRVNGAGR
ncbi:MAG: hypothetical protein JW958_13330 [Candidatus Eisenbacteria bacterium]|nr:hypothetical protein [Candidatus Eisenbacteria bacterium]